MADKKRMAEHSARTGEALNSLYGSSTPITSILPVQEKVDVSTTSSEFRTKGTRSPSRTTMPEKLLIQISDPGDAPRAPEVVANPGTLDRPDFANAGFRETPSSYDERRGAWMTRHPNYTRESAMFNTAVERYNTYVRNLATYNAELTNYNTRVAQRNTEVAKNTRITNQYQRDLKKFFTTLGKKKVSKKIGTRSRGARNPGTTSTRGSRL